MVTIEINVPDLNPNNKKTRRMQKAIAFADTQCGVCGRPIKNRSNAQVAVLEGNRPWQPGPHSVTFQPISTHGQLGEEYGNWGVAIGSHCAKKLPKEYRVSMRRVGNEWGRKYHSA